MPIRKYGVVIEAKANPIEDTGFDIESFSNMKLVQVPMFENEHTISFIIPYTQTNVNEMIGWCQAYECDEELWEVDLNDYFEDYLRLPSIAGKAMERKCRISKKLDKSPLRKILSIDHTDNELRVGCIKYYFGSEYLGLIRNGKRDGFGFMRDIITGVKYIGYWNNDIQLFDYEELLVDLENNIDGRIGTAFFYGDEGIVIGDVYPFEECLDIVIFKTNELYYGRFPKGSMMKKVNGIKIDCHNIRTEGMFKLDIISNMSTPFVD